MAPVVFNSSGNMILNAQGRTFDVMGQTSARGERW